MGKEASKSLRPFWKFRKEKQLRKKSRKRRTREPLYAKHDSRITEEKIFYFSWILIKILTKIQKRAIIMLDFSDNNRICRYVPILRLLRRGHHFILNFTKDFNFIRLSLKRPLSKYNFS